MYFVLRVSYEKTTRDNISSSFCGAGGTPPTVLQLTEAYCTNPALVSPFHLRRRSTSDGVRDLYQRKVELWTINDRSI
jgi:hypothetical protein